MLCQEYMFYLLQTFLQAQPAKGKYEKNETYLFIKIVFLNSAKIMVNIVTQLTVTLVT